MNETKHLLHAEIRKSADSAFDAEFVMSASTPDRVNDTIDPKAYKGINVAKIIALWQHQSDKPVGFWHSIKGVKDTLQGKLTLANTNLGKMVRQLLEDGVPLGASIGFSGSGKPNEAGGYHFTSIDLIECSVVSTPMHPRAMQVAKSFGFDPDQIFSTGPSSVPGDSGASAQSCAGSPRATHSEKGHHTMRLSERIQAAEKRLAQLRDKAVAVTEQFDADEADETALHEELKAVNTDIEKQADLVEELKKTETAIAERSEPIRSEIKAAPAVAPNLARNKDPKDPLDIFAKMAVATLVAKRDSISVDAALEKTYTDAMYLKDVNQVIRAKSVAGDPPLNTYTPGAAGDLVQAATASFVEAIAVESVAAKLGARCRQINFNGRQSAKLTKRNPTALAGLTEPAWVHEGRPIPIQGFGVGQQTIERGKMASIIPFTMELLESNLVVDLEAELRLAMVEAAAVRLDNTFFSNIAAVTRVHPAGILNGVTLTAGTAGGGMGAVSADVQALYNALTTARLGARPVLVLNSTDRMAAGFLRTTLGDLAFRDELASGTLMGIPVIDGPTIPQHTAVMVDAAYIGFGLDTPMFSMSTEAAIVTLNADGTAPSMAGARADGAVAGATAGEVHANQGVDLHTAAAASAPAYSFWQTYTGGLRLIQFGGWAPVATGAVQASDSTTWT